MSETEKEKVKKQAPVKAIVLSVVGILALVYLVFSFYFSSHFFLNTTVNDIVCSGKSADAVKEMITEQVSDYVLTLEENGGDTEEVVGTDISLTAVFDDSLEQLVEDQNGFSWPLYLFKENTLEAETMVTFQEDELQAVLANLQCMDTTQMEEPVDATITYTDGAFTIVEADYGSTINEEGFLTAVEEAVASLQTELNMQESGCYVLPTYTSESEEVQTALATLESYGNHTITYTFDDETEVLDEEAVSELLQVDENMNISVDEEAAAEFISTLASKYNTYGQPKEFTTTSGEVVTISNTYYGWLIDQDGELEQLKSDLMSTEDVTRDAVYTYTANSHGDQDWGGTYVEVNISAQKMYVYVDGNLELEASTVTGSIEDGNGTHTGVFFIQSKETERYLTGETYRSFVNYWMPFNGGEGFHDATWRSSFGGTIYLTSGSHGCVNLQKSVAAQLYDLVEVGTPVFVYRLESTANASQQTIANMVISKIDSVGEVTLDSETIMTEAQNLYNYLTDEGKALVTNYSLLQAQQAQLAALKAQAAAETTTSTDESTDVVGNE